MHLQGEPAYFCVATNERLYRCSSKAICPGKLFLNDKKGCRQKGCQKHNEMRQNHHVKKVATAEGRAERAEVRAECAERRAAEAEAETERLLVLLAVEQEKCTDKDAEIARLSHRVEQMQEPRLYTEVPFTKLS